MITVRDLRLAPSEKESSLKRHAARALHTDTGNIGNLKILKKSLDARKKDSIRWLYTVAVEIRKDEAKLLSHCSQASEYQEYRYVVPSALSDSRPVVVGFGPAGMFAGLLLAEAGLRPVILERGADVDTRIAAVRTFWETGVLDSRTNVQFGEGGAGAFSDGKLNTGTHDSRITFVLEQMHRFGAPEKVTYDAKPHVGTDVLARVVKNIREHIIELGGEVRFLSQMTALQWDNGVLSGVAVQGPDGAYRLPCTELVLALGHSARDTFYMLHDAGIPMERKAFAMGMRIEHLQRDVDMSQYGGYEGKLPAADYKLNVHLPDGNSVFTFCMCPGGYVVAAASESCGVCTNGMSYSGRGGENANSALLVTLTPEDFPGEGVMAGVEWQRSIERACFEAGGASYRAPAQRVGDFLSGRESTCAGRVVPTYRPGVQWSNLREILPEKLTGPVAEAIPLLAKKLKGFDDPDAVLTAPETRSSSPVRILRNGDSMMSSITGLYPCGEGAGYAGGITSAALDGMRCAEKIIDNHRIN